MLSLSLAVALVLDRLLGEIPRWHPLIAFGNTAQWLERCVRRLAGVGTPANGVVASHKLRLVFIGVLAWLLLVLVPAGLLLNSQHYLAEFWSVSLGILVLYFCIGGRSLAEHARSIAAPLLVGDLPMARQQLSRIVSRDTEQLDEQAITKAGIESVLENGSDAVIAPLFWFVVGGAPAALAYRLANTLDAMWGYRNEQYQHFGFAAARLDDVLNWIPARCCALAYALCGRTHSAVHCWRTQAYACDSPNAGPVMAAGAGALGIKIGGSATYAGQLHWRPVLGVGKDAGPADIERALKLLLRATMLCLVLLCLCELLL